MIIKLDNTNEKVANQIFTVFQNSYQVEAQLIGVREFPPLLRTATNIAHSSTTFYGYYQDNSLAAVIEVAKENTHFNIDSLTVDPSFFRKGIGSKLIDFVLANNKDSKTTVETAVVNIPAIKLYQKHGFVEFKRWIPSHGIEKLAMSVENTRQASSS